MALTDVIRPKSKKGGTSVLPLLLLGLAASFAAFAVPSRAFALCLGAGSAGLLMVGLSTVRLPFQRRFTESLEALLEADETPSYLSDARGNLIFVNSAAESEITGEARMIAEALEAHLVSAERLVGRLLLKLEGDTAAKEDVVNGHDTKRIRVTRVQSGVLVWRLDTWVRSPTSSRAELGNTLPMLAVGRDERVLSANEAALELFGHQPERVSEITADGGFELGRPQLLQTLSGPVLCGVSEIGKFAGRRELLFMPMDAPLNSESPVNGGLEALPVPLLKLEPDGMIIESNQMARDLLGTTKIDGMSMAVLLEGLGRSLQDWLQDMLIGRASHQSEFMKVRNPEISTFVQVIIKPAVEDGRNVLVAVLSDATELKTLEAQFVQSQKMQAIGQLAGGVAHDFNNILTAIRGHCDLLMLRHDSKDQDYSDLEQIRQNANRAAALVEQLLAYSRKQTLRLEVLDVEEVIADLTHLLNRLLGATVSLDFVNAGHALHIRADKRQLEQVLMNLVVNACDAMPDGGMISIQTRRLEVTQPLQRDRAEVQAGAYVVVEVTDQGTGIPADRLQKIFEPFFTTKRSGEGTGLGLSTAYGIVKQTGGFIFADSEVGAGTTFTLIFPSYVDADVVLPQGLARIAKEREDDDATTPSATGASILLVEDEAPVRAFASRALKIEGYKVLEAASGEDALELLQDPKLTVDAVVSDVIMPGLKGPEWVDLALQRKPELKVAFVTGYAEDAFDGNGPKIENAKFLQKPFSLKELAETVREMLQEDESVVLPGASWPVT